MAGHKIKSWSTKMVTACRELVICTVANTPKPYFQPLLPWWPHLSDIPGKGERRITNMIKTTPFTASIKLHHDQVSACDCALPCGPASLSAVSSHTPTPTPWLHCQGSWPALCVLTHSPLHILYGDAGGRHSQPQPIFLFYHDWLLEAMSVQVLWGHFMAA